MSERSEACAEVIDRRRALGKAIRAARGAQSQTDVGRTVGRPQSSVSVWETGGLELGVDRVYELEDLFGAPHGSLLGAAGYIDVQPGSWWAAYPSAATAEFPDLAAEWLSVHGALVEAAALLRECEQEPVALEFLLGTRPLTHLRLSWEIWSSISAQMPADAEERDLERALGRSGLERCRWALWGEGSTAQVLRLCDPLDPEA